jgi:hypothetical protein
MDSRVGADGDRPRPHGARRSDRASQLGAPLGFDHDASSQLLLALEADGAVLRGWFSPGGVEEEWCDRRLLARIHRATLQRLRAESSRSRSRTSCGSCSRGSTSIRRRS